MTRRAAPQLGVDRMVSISWSGEPAVKPPAHQGRASARGLEGRPTLQHPHASDKPAANRVAGPLFLLPSNTVSTATIYLEARLEDQAQCILVIIGATPEGKKELVGFADGVRESAQSWRELLIDIKQRGLEIAPDLAVGDGALGFWKALGEIWPTTREQRCWVHYAELRIMPTSAAKPVWEAVIAVKEAA